MLTYHLTALPTSRSSDQSYCQQTTTPVLFIHTVMLVKPYGLSPEGGKKRHLMNQYACFKSAWKVPVRLAEAKKGKHFIPGLRRLQYVKMRVISGPFVRF